MMADSWTAMLYILASQRGASVSRVTHDADTVRVLTRPELRDVHPTWMAWTYGHPSSSVVTAKYSQLLRCLTRRTMMNTRNHQFSDMHSHVRLLTTSEATVMISRLRIEMTVLGMESRLVVIVEKPSSPALVSAPHAQCGQDSRIDSEK